MRYNPQKHRLPAFELHGMILVDKPLEWTSFDVVNFVRARFNVPKVGHCGTLDPAATGLLVLVFGKFTRLSEKFSGENKTYEATVLLGTETDSQDSDGEVIATGDYSGVTREACAAALAGFEGEIMQIPPMVSAVKRDGKRLYELARQGIEIEREPRPVTIHRLEMTRFELPEFDITVDCSKGTYVRTLASDLGDRLGCGAMLKALRRTASGGFSIAEAVTVDPLKTWEQPDLEIHLRHFLHSKMAALAGA